MKKALRHNKLVSRNSNPTESLKYAQEDSHKSAHYDTASNSETPDII